MQSWAPEFGGNGYLHHIRLAHFSRMLNMPTIHPQKILSGWQWLTQALLYGMQPNNTEPAYKSTAFGKSEMEVEHFSGLILGNKGLN